MQKDYDGLRSFLTECEKHGEVKVIKNADWDLEIGALTETVSELIDEPPYDVEPEADATVRPTVGAVDLPEHFKYNRQHFVLDAYAGVSHFEFDA